MAKLIEVVGLAGGSNTVATLPSKGYVKSGTSASVGSGYLVIDDGSNAGYVKAAPDATDTDSTILGVATEASDETTTADGRVAYVSAPWLLCRMFAKTAGSLTAAMRNDRFILDVTSGSYTFDQATTTKGFIEVVDILDSTTGYCLVKIHMTA